MLPFQSDNSLGIRAPPAQSARQFDVLSASFIAPDNTTMAPTWLNVLIAANRSTGFDDERKMESTMKFATICQSEHETPIKQQQDAPVTVEESSETSGFGSCAMARAASNTTMSLLFRRQLSMYC